MPLRSYTRLLRLMTLLVTLSVAMPGSVVSQLLFYCAMSGEVGTACGCPHAAAQQEKDSPEIAPTSCCEQVGETERSPSVVRVDAPTGDLALPLVAGPVPPMTHPAQTLRVLRRMAEPAHPRGPPHASSVPIPIRFCSFLI